MPDEKRLCQRCGQMKDDVETCEVEASEAFKIDYCKPCRKAVAKRLPVAVVKTEREELSKRPTRTEPVTAVDEDGLDELSKKELLALAEERGVEISNKRAKNDEIIAALREAGTSAGGEDAQTETNASNFPPNDSSPPPNMAPAPAPETTEGE